MHTLINPAARKTNLLLLCWLELVLVLVLALLEPAAKSHLFGRHVCKSIKTTVDALSTHSDFDFDSEPWLIGACHSLPDDFRLIGIYIMLSTNDDDDDFGDSFGAAASTSTAAARRATE
ncbi:hypothetical protein TYRP_014954 [Tyrophagus putrescentiae]|nr:hypothetical protein TYRP_014954 [Tyrophagus putrescentiae]